MMGFGFLNRMWLTIIHFSISVHATIKVHLTIVSS